MAIKLVVSNTVRFSVKGTINDEKGIAQPFDFALVCRRLSADDIQVSINSGDNSTTTDFMASVVNDWGGVRDDNNVPVPYSPDQLRELLKLPGLSNLAYNTYLSEVGAKAKN